MEDNAYTDAGQVSKCSRGDKPKLCQEKTPLAELLPTEFNPHPFDLKSAIQFLHNPPPDDIVVPDKYKYIDIGERDMPNAMPWDKMEPAKYIPWANNANFDMAIENSKKRISENEYLKLIDENAQWVKQQQKDNVFPLNYEAYKKVIDKNEIVSTVRIGNEKYNLYPTEDIVVSGETGNKRLNYKVKLNSNISSKDRGKIVGQYSADDGVNEFTGSLIMR